MPTTSAAAVMEPTKTSKVELPKPMAETGTKVGNRIPDFELVLIDGNTVTSGDLVQSRKPAFLFFHAVWWPVCRAELRRLATLDPKYTKDIAFYIVGQDPTEPIEFMEMDRQKQGYPWPVAEITGSGLRDLNVFLQSTKIAIDGSGLITYRDGFGQGNLDKWRNALENLATTRDALR